MKIIWDDVVEKKMHITGGIGAIHQYEGFGYGYFLPENGYLETCAGVGLAFWSANMNIAFGNSSYADVFEKVVYNNILSDEGGRFFHNQIRNMVVEIGDKDFINFDKKYIWVSHNQMIGFIKQGVVDIETRLLFTSLNFDKIL